MKIVSTYKAYTTCTTHSKQTYLKLEACKVTIASRGFGHPNQ